MAIVRRPLECISCGTRIVTRTGIGHGNKQVHAFPCPECQIGITYSLLLNQKRITYKHAPKPENARWVRTEKGARAEKTFYPELLTPRTFSFSPFLTIPFLFTNFSQFQTHEKARSIWRTNHWPALTRLVTHYEQDNGALFDKEIVRLGEQPSKPTKPDRLELLLKVQVACLRWFTFDDSDCWPRIKQRVSLANGIAPILVRQFADEFRASGRMYELWKQIHRIHDEFMKNFPPLSPILQLRYWKDIPKSLDDYEVADKQFSELRHLYASCFETLCRISVIAIAFETIIFHKALETPTKNGTLSLWQFEQLQNAQKVPHLNKYPISDMFIPFLNTDLRNGISHNAAHYDAAMDEIVCVKGQGARLVRSRLKYTDFCHTTLKLFSRMWYLEAYFDNLLFLTKGYLR